MTNLTLLIDKLNTNQTLTKEEWTALISGRSESLAEYLFSLAREKRHHYYGHDVYIRGLIEFTNYCKNDCLYCGIRKSNRNANRYRLSKEEILSCRHAGYNLGFRTFVLQGERMDIIQTSGHAASSRVSVRIFPTAPSPFPSVKKIGKAIRNFTKQEQTAICFATRLTIIFTMPNSIHRL